jgi:dynein assembly factor with WDR repeat domains 1
MKLKRFLLRYYPPGIILEYELRDKTREMKEVRLGISDPSKAVV